MQPVSRNSFSKLAERVFATLFTLALCPVFNPGCNPAYSQQNAQQPAGAPSQVAPNSGVPTSGAPVGGAAVTNAQPPEGDAPEADGNETADDSAPQADTEPNKPDNANANGTPAVETIKRPKEPKTPPNKKEFDVRPDDAGLLQFQFRDQSWPDVLEWLAEVSGLALDWQELPADSLSIATPKKITIETTKDTVNRHLLARGFTLLEYPGVMQVVKTQGVNIALVPRVLPEQLETLPPNRFVRTNFGLQSLIASEIVEELKPLISTNGAIQAFKNTNRIEAVDTAANLLQVFRVLSEEQSDGVLRNLAREFPLEHVRAENVRDQLAKFLDLESATPIDPQEDASGSNNRAQQQMIQAQLAAAQGQTDGSSPPSPTKKEIHLIANHRRNSIIANASPDKMAIIAAFIARVDVANPNEEYQALTTRMRVYRIANIEPKKFVASLMALNVLEPTTRLEVDDKHKSMIAYASLADHLTIQTTLTKLDGSSREVEVIQLRRLRADEVAGTIRMLMGGDSEKKDRPTRSRFSYYFDQPPSENKEDTKDQFRVGANVSKNQVILWANEFENAEIKKLLVKLGEILPEGGSKETIRVIDANRSPATLDYLKRLKRIWEESGYDINIPDPSEVESPETDSASPDTEPSPVKKPDPSPKPAPIPPTDSSTLGATPAPATPAPAVHRIDPVKPSLLVAISQDPARDESQTQRKGRASITIRFDAEGNLLLDSKDTRALDQIEQWMLSNAPPSEEYQIFKIQHARPYWIRLNLEDYFKEDSTAKKNDNDAVFRWLFDIEPAKQEDNSPQLGKKRKIKFMSDTDTSTVLVSGATPSQRETIKKLIELWDKPAKEDKQSFRYSQTVQIEYSKAQSIAVAIKDAFRDLLSSNDKAMERKEERGDSQSKESKHKENESVSGGAMNYTFAGKLSLGVDEVTNTIIVSAKGEDLLKLVCDLIEELDRKAKKSESVQVVQVNGTSTKALEKALKNLLRPKVGLDQKGQNPQNLRLSPGLGGQIVPNFPYGNNSSDDASDNAPNSADN